MVIIICQYLKKDISMNNNNCNVHKDRPKNSQIYIKNGTISKELNLVISPNRKEIQNDIDNFINHEFQMLGHVTLNQKQFDQFKPQTTLIRGQHIKFTNRKSMKKPNAPPSNLKKSQRLEPNLQEQQPKYLKK